MKRYFFTRRNGWLVVVTLLGLGGCESAKDVGIQPSGPYANYAFDGPGGIDPATGERYNEIEENPFVETVQQAVSTFSIDADGASYANVRRFLTANQKPPKDAIRTEELINYFTYDYPQPTGVHPVGVDGEVSTCPWNAANKLVRIGLRGKSTPKAQLPASNLVLLIDVSGSMSDANKLPLLKESLPLLVDELRPQDRLAIVTYAGSAGVALPATAGSDKAKINAAIAGLGAGGSTAGAQGILTAYEIAGQQFVKGGNNRVILMTDGDFNVGPSSQKELVELIEKKRESGIFLTVIGVGTGNLNDGMMEQVANKGNGVYEYLDNLNQARKVFSHEFSKFYTVAKDVKIQVEFNPAVVKSYRLIGYENRKLNKEDFTDDKKDAGELNDGQTITALYEITPVPNLHYEVALAFRIDFRYKFPDADVSQALRLDISDYQTPFAKASENLRWAAAVTGYGLLLRDSRYKGTLSYDGVKAWAGAARSFDPHDLRRESLNLVDLASKR